MACHYSHLIDIVSSLLLLLLLLMLLLSIPAQIVMRVWRWMSCRRQGTWIAILVGGGGGTCEPLCKCWWFHISGLSGLSHPYLMDSAVFSLSISVSLRT